MEDLTRITLAGMVWWNDRHLVAKGRCQVCGMTSAEIKKYLVLLCPGRRGRIDTVKQQKQGGRLQERVLYEA